MPFGFNHNYVLRKKENELIHAADLFEPISGRLMEVWTTQPGLQFYSAGYLGGHIFGKNEINYRSYHAVCLEAQHFPDSPNYPNFPSTILQPHEKYMQRNCLKFSN